VRVVSATNKDLARAVRDGSFREDLLYRLHVFPVWIAPLRERPGDIPELVQHFIQLICTRIGRAPSTVGRSAMDLLVRHRWPGNVRELANIVERLIILSMRGEIGDDDVRAALPVTDGGAGNAGPLPSPAATLPLTEELDNYERTLITRALSAARGNVAEAARSLATDRANLYRRLKRLGIDAGS
jgi:DNA-binding NtrC family response regulator